MAHNTLKQSLLLNFCPAIYFLYNAYIPTSGSIILGPSTSFSCCAMHVYGVNEYSWEKKKKKIHNDPTVLKDEHSVFRSC